MRCQNSLITSFPLRNIDISKCLDISTDLLFRFEVFILCNNNNNNTYSRSHYCGLIKYSLFIKLNIIIYTCNNIVLIAYKYIYEMISYASINILIPFHSRNIFYNILMI